MHPDLFGRLPQEVCISFCFFTLSLTALFRLLLATICDKGLCPCPCCLAPKAKLDHVSQISDTKIQTNQAHKYQDISESVNKACNAIYKQGVPIGGVYVQQLLKPTSTVPTLVSSSPFCVQVFEVL